MCATGLISLSVQRFSDTVQDSSDAHISGILTCLLGYFAIGVPCPFGSGLSLHTKPALTQSEAALC